MVTLQFLSLLWCITFNIGIQLILNADEMLCKLFDWRILIFMFDVDGNLLFAHEVVLIFV